MRVANFGILFLAEFCPFRIDPPMEPEQEGLSKLYSGPGIHQPDALNIKKHGEKGPAHPNRSLFAEPIPLSPAMVKLYEE